MPAFTPDQWLVLLLVFLLGLFIGLAVMANPKWKRLYRDEAARREALEAEHAELRRAADEKDSLRHAAARDEERRRLATEAERDAAEERAAEAARERRISGVADRRVAEEDRRVAEEDAARRRDTDDLI